MGDLTFVLIILFGMIPTNVTTELTLISTLMPDCALLMTKVRAFLILGMIVPSLDGTKNITPQLLPLIPIWLNIVQIHPMKVNARIPIFIATSQKVVLKTARNVMESNIAFLEKMKQ